jgi:hypothetical protein
MRAVFFKALKPAAKAKPAAKPEESPAKKAGELGHFADLLGVLKEHRSGGEFGPHCIDAGHHVAFRAGALSGAGKVAAVGRDGCTVDDGTGRHHQIHWREITGHYAPSTPAKKAKK